MAPSTHSQRDWSHRAAYPGRSPTVAVRVDAPRGVSPPPAWAFCRRPSARRPGLLRAVRAAFRASLRPAVDSDRDLPATYVPPLPLPARLRDALWRGDRLARMAALLPDRPL